VLAITDRAQSRQKMNTGLVIAYERGKQAFLEGAFNSPFTEGTIKQKEWQRGFDEAFLQNKEERHVQGI